MKNKKEKSKANPANESKNKGTKNKEKVEKTTFKKKLQRFLSSPYTNWSFFMEDIEKNKKISKSFQKSMNIIGIVLFILLISFFPLYLKHLNLKHLKFLVDIKNLLISSNWWKILLFSFISYVLIRIYWDWIKKVWKFLQEDKIVHYIFLVMIPIGIIFFGYNLFSPLRSITIDNQKQDINAIIMTSSSLHGFYASLFTAIAVIVAVFALINWRRHKELEEKLEKFKEVEEKVEFLSKEKKLADWAKEKVDKLGLNTFKIKKFNQEDKKKLNAIKNHVIGNLTDRGWLEIFLAHQIITEEKDFEKAENILSFIEERDLIDEKSNIQSFLYHSMGVLHWEKYRHEKYKNNWNFFQSSDENLKKPKDTDIENAKGFLNNSIKKYFDSINFINEQENESNHFDRSRANLSVVQIELSKFYFNENNDECQKYLNDAKKNLEKIKEKDHNTYYDMARVCYYLDELEKAGECFEKFQKRKGFFSDKDKIKIENEFAEYMETEGKEFRGEGFPAKLKNGSSKTDNKN